jgi:predicted ATPase
MVRPARTARGHSKQDRIKRIRVSGFKSIGDKQAIDLRPLTLLAGPNSSGKSSIMQSLLLLKQTLEAPYDPGPLLLNGPNVKFTSAEQMFSRVSKTNQAHQIVVGLEMDDKRDIEIRFGRHSKGGIEVQHLAIRYLNGYHIDLASTASSEELVNHPFFKEQLKRPGPRRPLEGRLVRDRCFFMVEFDEQKNADSPFPLMGFRPGAAFAPSIENTIHLPGLRGNLERTYPVSAVGETYPGTFEKYAASVIAHWASEGKEENLARLGDELKNLGLTWKVEAKAIDDTQVELRVGRLLHPARGGAHDLVNIADVGFGVSQTLPIVVALLAAEPGQIVYVEQPETHLHPRAQVAMALVLANAANRGVQVVAETHSSLLLLGVQSLVAKGTLVPEKVKLHWFQRDENSGNTNVVSRDLDGAGRFGDWPEDFDDVSLRAQKSYLDAAEKQLLIQ